MSWVRIGDLVTVSGGGTPRRSESSYYNGDIPWVTPKDMKRHRIDASEVAISEAGLADSPAKLVPAGSTLVVVRSGVLKHTLPVAITTRDVTVNQDMKALIPRPDEVDPQYLVRLIKAQESRVLRSVRATTADNFQIDDLLRIEIPLPRLAEQRRIAAILDEADAVRALARHQRTVLDEAASASFELMVRSSSGTSTTIDALITSTQYGTSQKASAEGSVPVLRMGNVTYDGRIDLSDMKFLDLPERDANKYLVHKGDVLFNRTNSAELVGKTAVYREAEPRAYAGYLVRLRPRSPELGEYIAGYLNSSVGKRKLRKMAKSIVGMANINATEVRSIRLPEPNLAMLGAYAAARGQAESEAHALDSRLRTLDSLFASLQNRAFRGEL